VHQRPRTVGPTCCRYIDSNDSQGRCCHQRHTPPQGRQRMRIPHGHHRVANHSCSRCSPRHCSLLSSLERDSARSRWLEVQLERPAARAASPPASRIFAGEELYAMGRSDVYQQLDPPPQSFSGALLSPGRAPARAQAEPPPPPESRPGKHQGAPRWPWDREATRRRSCTGSDAAAPNGEAASRARQASVEAAALAEIAAVLFAHGIADEPGTPWAPAGSSSSAIASDTLSWQPRGFSSTDSVATHACSPADSATSPAAMPPGIVVPPLQQPVVELPLEATSAAAAPPRWRLRGKQVAPPGFSRPASRSRSPRARIEYMLARDRFRLHYCSLRPTRLPYKAAWSKASKAWTALTAEQREGWIRSVLNEAPDIAPPGGAARETGAERSRNAGRGRPRRAAELQWPVGGARRCADTRVVVPAP